jgi:hydroxymethylbilane synthase
VQSAPLQSAALQSASLRIGTRASPLALAQAEETRRRLIAAHGLAEGEVTIVPMRTTGDAIRDRPLAEAGGKGLFTKEIEEALLAGAVDLAVHSGKDLPTALPEGLAILAALPREDPRDAFLSPHAPALAALPQGALLGTSSLRRKAMALRLRPDLRVVEFRGNVETRLKKLADGVAAATLLAMAGLKRLGLADRVTAVLDPDAFVPAVAQGAILIEARAGDARAAEAVSRVDDRDTAIAVACERAFLAALDGSCRTPIGGHARLEEGVLRFRGIIVSHDGTRAHETLREGAPADAAAIGRDAGEELRRRGGPDFFA